MSAPYDTIVVGGGVMGAAAGRDRRWHASHETSPARAAVSAGPAALV